MALLSSTLAADFTPAIGDFILQVDGGSVVLLRRNAGGQALAQCGSVGPGQAVVIANPVSGAVYQVQTLSGSPTFRADQ